MRRLCLFVILAAPVSAQMLMMGETSEGFVSIFNGRDIDQWDGDPRLWKVERNVIVGSTDGAEPLKANSFLIYKGERYRDFELRFDIRLRNHNSGVQFRSEVEPDWVVKGPQADASDGSWGLIRGQKSGSKGSAPGKPGEWQEYSILCRGGSVRLTLNGVMTAELSGETPKDGVIALELHAGDPMRVEFRNLRIKKY